MSKTNELPELNGKDPTTGRFVAGNTYGTRGRRKPRKEIEQEYLFAFNDGCHPITLAEVVRVLTERALAGNLKAAELLLRYSQPAQSMRLELLADEHQEYRVAGQTPAQGMREMVARIERKLIEREIHERAVGLLPPEDEN